MVVSAVDQFCLPAQTQIELGVELVTGAATCLDRLKEAVLPSKSSAAASALGGVHRTFSRRSSRRLPCVALTSISGGGGVGKTSTCSLLYEDSEVRTHFSKGAIVWIDVGKDATKAKVKNEIQRVVSKFGGKRSVQVVRSADNVFEAVGIASDFFSGKCILVVIDNVWETPAGSSVKRWTSALALIASHPGSAVVATTRSSSIAQGSGLEQLNLGRFDLTSDASPDWRVAEELYDVLLKTSAGNARFTAGYDAIRRKALLLSCGLLLGIRTFASLVQSYREIDDDAEAVLLKIEGKCIGLGDSAVGDDAKATIGHPGLFAAMEESLSFLDVQKSCFVKSKPLLPSNDEGEEGCYVFGASYAPFSKQAFSSRYAAVYMMRASSTAIPFSLLCHLWHVATTNEAKAIVRRFVDIGLARIEGSDLKYFVLHDLQFEFCSRLREKCTDSEPSPGLWSYCDSVNGDNLFLSSCESFLISKYDAALWARFCFENLASSDAVLREYLSHNLVRHLCAAAQSHDVIGECSSAADVLRREVVSVLSDFRWLHGRSNSIGGRNDVLRDFALVFGRILCDADANFLHEIRKALLFVSDDDVCQSVGSFAGLLIQMAQSTYATEKVSRAVSLCERLAQRAEDGLFVAWLKPFSGCCRALVRGELAKACAESLHSVNYAVTLGDGTLFVCVWCDEKLMIFDSTYLATALVLDDMAGVVCITAVETSHLDGLSLIFSGMADGTVFFNVVYMDDTGRLSETGSKTVGESASRVLCLSASDDGKFVAAGCKNGSFFEWERDDANFGGYLFVDGLSSVTAGTNIGEVQSVVVSASGHFVAACTSGGYLFISKSGGAKGRESNKTGHVLFL